MKKCILSFLICVLPFLIKAQNFAWAKCGNGAGGYCEGMAIAVDTAGNSFIVGQFDTPTIVFGTYTLTNAGTNGDMYVVKYDLNGNIIWAMSAGGINDDLACSVCTDPGGNVFVTGFFSGPSMVMGTYTLVNSGSGGDVFLAKYDTNGNVLWVKSAGGGAFASAYGVSADAAGNAFIAGGFIGPLAIGSTTLINSGSYDALFIAKYDANGNPLWAKGTAGNDEDALAIATDMSGNTYITGLYSGSTLALGTYTLTNSGLGALFLGKYDANGNVLWARSSAGPGFTEGYGVTTDASGNVYVTGDFGGPNTSFGTYTITNPGGGTMFLTKYDPSGNVLWVRSAGGAGGHTGYSVSSYTGGVYVAGGLSSAVSVFGTYTLTTPTSSVDPMFIVQYDLNGNVLCADVLSSGGDDQSGVSVDKHGNAYITGDYISNPFVVGTTTLAAVGAEDVFVAKFSCQPDVGIKVLEKNDGSTLYPNPNNGIFNLKISNELSNAELILINSLGQKVHGQKLEPGINTLHITGLKKGFYNYILLQDKQKFSDGKLIIE